ncbi:poly(rC)-binding protein 3-like isoform X1 [Tachypleus tridentatus]|uniref:poly(rC)-binding protein 3-like isoform X1 n=1 Tax=Tachypleus tridentatus TaxID=6853 RepID=UPI003FD2A7C3
MTTVGSETLSYDPSAITLTIRSIMQGKEVGSIIGQKGDNIKKIREESGAKINISDSSCPERIITVTGITDVVLKAFALVAKRLEEVRFCILKPFKISKDLHNISNTDLARPPVTVRLIVPTSQCGSIIGKNGSKIKEIIEVTGASIQVASEMLPNSTERVVIVSGTAGAVTKCIYQICCVLVESPMNGTTIPYRPKPTTPSVIPSGGQAYVIQGRYAIPHPDIIKLHHLAAVQNAPMLSCHTLGPQSTQAVNKKLELYVDTGMFASPNLALLSMRNTLRRNTSVTSSTATPETTTEMNIPNDLIGCVIGKGGAKISEIRQLSGATIKISTAEESAKYRTVLILGTPECISVAQHLINASIEAHKILAMDPNSNHVISQNYLVKPSPLALSPAAVYTLDPRALFAYFNNFTFEGLKNSAFKTRVGFFHKGSKKSESSKYSPY